MCTGMHIDSAMHMSSHVWTHYMPHAQLCGTALRCSCARIFEVDADVHYKYASRNFIPHNCIHHNYLRHNYIGCNYMHTNALVFAIFAIVVDATTNMP